MQLLALCLAPLAVLLLASRDRLEYVHELPESLDARADAALTPEQARDFHRDAGPSAEQLRSIQEKLRVPARELRGDDPDEWEGVQLDENRCIRSLDLEDISISGELEALKDLTSLRSLYLSDTKITGGLEALRGMHQLERLWLDNTVVSGQLESLTNLRGLRELLASNTKVGGGLEPLIDMHQLEQLSLDNTGVSGPLEPLRNLGSLQYLLLSNTSISGELQALRDMHKLQKLWLHNTEVSGSLEALKDLGGLRELLLSNTHISGELESLRDMHQLERLCLDNTGVSGPLEPLTNLGGLQELLLKTTHISGELEALRDMHELQKLWLDKTGVSGPLAPLANLRNLQFLLFSNTNISGELEALRDMHRLKEALLDNTEVSGPLEPLADLQNLRLLRLQGTNVEDDISQLIGMSSLEEAGGSELHAGPRAPDNLVAGPPPGSRANVLPVGTDLQDLRSRFFSNESERLLPALLTLDVWHCPLDGEVQDLLKIFSFSGRLARIIANRANLSGELPDMMGGCLKDISVDGSSFNQRCDQPLRFALQSLDVADNRIHQVAGFSASVYVSLANNSDMFVEKRALQKAVQTNLQVDLASTKVANAEAVAELFSDGTLTKTANLTESSLTITVLADRMLPDLLKQRPAYCQCEEMKAFYKNGCEDCSKLHLDCQQHGLEASSAPPQVGYARLEAEAPSTFRCLEPAEDRCNVSANGTALGCAAGYEGPLCVACSWGYRSRAGACTPCEVGSDERTRWKYLRWVAGATTVVAVMGASFFLWRRNRSLPAEPAEPTRWSVMQPLLVAQGLVLLQLFQLWGLLVALHLRPEGRQRPDDLWAEEYVLWLQLTASGFRDATSLECWFGRTANSVMAQVGPCVPVVLLALCMLPEAVSHGSGVSMALKVLSLLYIGGASSCASLMRCQHVDGGKNWLGENYAFRTAMPEIKCSQPARVADGIALLCAVCYGLLIPSLLAYLMFKQHQVLAPSRRFVSHAMEKAGSFTVWVLPVQSKSLTGEEKKDEMKTPSLLAVAVARSCIYFSGSVRIQLHDECLILQAVQQEDERQIDLDANSLLWKALQSKADADLRRCQALERMLQERHVIEEVASSDRVVAGAKELFTKYVACQNLWFEIAMKIVAVALVAVVRGESGLELTLGVTLCTAVALGTLRPYRQHQVNDLQCFCFFCLAVAAVGFSQGWVRLSHAALLAPCAMAGAQVLRPDGPEALALRLFQDLKAKWPALEQGETVELALQSISFL
ncbi:GSO1 [Symbiodinium sp. CCMP2592]|nr:GSO1 [Symbiodinium sp. CCMP2592]